MTSENTNSKLSFLEGLDERISSLEPDSPPLRTRYGKEMLEDYLKLKALLRYEKNQTSPQPLQPFLSQSDQLLLELDHEIELGAEEEDESPDNFAFLKDLSSYNSKKNSVFSLNPPSKKNSLFAPNPRRHPSFLSDFHKRRASNNLLPNPSGPTQPKRSSAMFPLMNNTQGNEEAKKRSSALLLGLHVTNEETRKRNSSILEDITLKILQKPKVITGRGIFDNIKKSSKICSLSLSSLKSSDQNSNGGYDSGNQDLVEEDKPLSDTSSDTQSNISQEDLPEAVQEETFTKISFVKYGNKRFLKNKALEKNRIGDLKKMNLLEDFYQGPDSPMNTEHEFKKFNASDKKFLPYQPYYLFDDQNIIKHKYKRSKNALYITKKSNEPSKEEEEERRSLEFGTLKTLDSASLKDKANFYITKSPLLTTTAANKENGLDMEKTQEAFTMTFKRQNLYSQKLDLAHLKNYSAHPHLQVQASQNQDVIDSHFINDCGSKRGTFIQLKTHNPKLLQEGDLFLLNSKFGFYIKPLEEEEILPQENTVLEILCVNQIAFNSSMSLSNSPTLSSPSLNLSKGKSITSSPNSELKELFHKKKSPNVKLELVRWNETLEEYEENGTIVILYNDINNIGAFESASNEMLNPAFSTKNWVNLFEGSKIMREVSKRLELEKNALLFYNLELKLWSIEILSSSSLDDETPLNIITRDAFISSNTGGHSIELDSAINHQVNVLKGINLLPALASKKEDENLSSGTGIWLSCSRFDILQEKFENTNIQVGLPSHVMFEDIIFRMNHEKILTLSN